MLILTNKHVFMRDCACDMVCVFKLVSLKKFKVKYKANTSFENCELEENLIHLFCNFISAADLNAYSQRKDYCLFPFKPSLDSVFCIFECRKQIGNQSKI